MTITEAQLRQTSRDLGWLARLGMVAAGLTYGLIGLLAIKVAIDGAGKPEGKGGALETIAQGTLGKAVLAALAVGFAGYALWGFLTAALGDRLEGAGELDGTERLKGLGRGLVYGALCATAVKLLLGGGSGGGEERQASAFLLDLPAGPWIVGALGLVVVGIGAYSVYEGLAKTFEDDLRTGEMSPTVRRWVCRLGTVGYTARGVVLGLVGIFLVRAALEYDPNEARGIDGALAELAQQPYGRVLLGVVAAGLLAYGAFYLPRAKYRRL